jgi:hypothetical protein
MAYEERSCGDQTHLVPAFSQKEQDGRLLSHLVRRARQTWQALFARFRGYAAVPRGAGRLWPLLSAVSNGDGFRCDTSISERETLDESAILGVSVAMIADMGGRSDALRYPPTLGDLDAGSVE